MGKIKLNITIHIIIIIIIITTVILLVNDDVVHMVSYTHIISCTLPNNWIVYVYVINSFHLKVPFRHQLLITYVFCSVAF